MENQVLSIDQMKHLQELGLDTSKASMCWRRTTRDWRGEEVKGRWSLTFNKPFISSNFERYETVTTFTLQDILELLPFSIEFSGKYFRLALLPSFKNKLYFSYINGDYKPYINSIHGEKVIIDAAYEMLCWCIEKGYIQTK